MLTYTMPILISGLKFNRLGHGKKIISPDCVAFGVVYKPGGGNTAGSQIGRAFHLTELKGATMIIDPEILISIPNSDDQTCFGCGARNPHGLHMQFSTDGDRVYSFMKVPATMTGWDKTVHGGILTTILDEIMGWSVIYLLKKIGMTRSVAIDFHKAVNTQERLTIVSSIREKRSERSVKMEGAIYDARDTLCVEGTGDFTTMRPKAAIRLGLVGEDYMKMFASIL